MEPTTINEKLDWITNIFLQEEDDYALLSSAIKQYSELLTSIIAIDLTTKDAENNVQLDTGIALGTRWAAFCINDLMRTKRFIKGTYEAVRSLTSQRDAPIHLLYAGTGPFAALILPLTRKFTPQELQFSLLEINPLSFDCLQRVIDALQIEKYIRAVENIDACKYSISKKDRIDILLCETMQRALLREPQVSIVYSLLTQINNDVILIPQKIELQLTLYSYERHLKKMMEDAGAEYYSVLGSFFELSPSTLRNLKWEDNERLIPTEVKINIPPVAITRNQNLCVFTLIEIFGKETLSVNECSLTMPMMLADMNKIEPKPSSVTVSYHINKTASIEFAFDKNKN